MVLKTDVPQLDAESRWKLGDVTFTAGRSLASVVRISTDPAESDPSYNFLIKMDDAFFGMVMQ